MIWIALRLLTFLSKCQRQFSHYYTIYNLNGVRQGFTLFAKHAWNRASGQMLLSCCFSNGADKKGPQRVRCPSRRPPHPGLGQAASTTPPTSWCGVEKSCRLATQSAFLPNYIQPQLTSIRLDHSPETRRRGVFGMPWVCVVEVVSQSSGDRFTSCMSSQQP